MKKVMLVVIIGILLIGVGAALDFAIDNYKVFDRNQGKYGKAIIYDSGQIGEDKRLTEVTLLSNTKRCGESFTTYCYADLKVKTFKEGNLLSDLNFKKLESNGWNRDTLDNVEITLRTNTKVSPNSTEYIYEPYNYESKPAGNYYLKFKGYPDVEETWDWLGEWNGIEVENWALWNGSTGTGLLAWYAMNDSFKDEKGVINLTEAGTVTFGTGKNQQGAVFDGVLINHLYNISTVPIPTQRNGTIEAWVKIADNSTNKCVYSHSTTVGNTVIRLCVRAKALVLVVPKADNAVEEVYYNNSANINTSDFVHIAGTWGDTNMNLFINGIQVNSSTKTDSTLPGTNDGFCIGASCSVSVQTGTDESFNGTIDDVKIWNFRRSASEILSDFPSTDISITTTLVSPSDGLTNEISTQIFNATQTAVNSELINSTLFVWNNATSTIFGTNLTNVNGTTNSTSVSLSGFDISTTYAWNFLTCAGNTTGTLCAFAAANRTLTNSLADTLAFCNVTYTVPYINFTFKNETTSEEKVNATIDSSFTYWVTNQNNNRSFTHTNGTENPSYSFCFNDSKKTINTIIKLDYNNIESQQRTYEQQLTLTNATTNKTLFLLPTSLGLFVTFQVTNIADQVISGVNVTIVKSSTQIASDFTNAAGAATFFLNPDSTYTFSFDKAGFDTFADTFKPTQTTYTITLGGGETAIQSPNDYTSGITYSFQPTEIYLDNATLTSFNFTLTSSLWDITEFGFVLTNGSLVLGTGSLAGSNTGTVNINRNTGNNNTIVMDAYWLVDGNYSNASRTWVVYNFGNNSYSVFNFFEDFKTYKDAGIFGLDDFGVTIIIFVIIFLFVGVLSFKFGLRSPETLIGLIFGMVIFFDIGIGLLPDIFGVPHFITIFVAIVIVGIYMREAIR